MAKMLTKDDAHAAARREMTERLRSGAWTLQQKIALAARVLAAAGHESGLSGQISARADAGEQYFMLEFGLGFDEIDASNVHLVDADLRVLSNEAMVNPANRFHLWIYRARPDVMAIVHTHAPYASALSMIGEPLKAAHMDAMALYDDCAYLPEWPGVPIADEEGEIISRAIGTKRAILLAHHGLLATGRNIEEAVVIANTIERASRLQLLASAAGKIRDVDDAAARQAHDYRSFPRMLDATFAHLARRILREHPEVLE